MGMSMDIVIEWVRDKNKDSGRQVQEGTNVWVLYSSKLNGLFLEAVTQENVNFSLRNNRNVEGKLVRGKTLSNFDWTHQEHQVRQLGWTNWNKTTSQDWIRWRAEQRKWETLLHKDKITSKWLAVQDDNWIFGTRAADSKYTCVGNEHLHWFCQYHSAWWLPLAVLPWIPTWAAWGLYLAWLHLSQGTFPKLMNWWRKELKW